MTKTGKDYHEKFIAACRELGIRDMTLGHRPVWKEPLTKEGWEMLYYAYMAFQYQVRLIVAANHAKESD